MAGVLTATSSLLAFSVTLAAIFLKEKRTWQVVLGAALMVCGVLLIVFSKPGDKAESGNKKNDHPETGTVIYESKPMA